MQNLTRLVHHHPEWIHQRRFFAIHTSIVSSLIAIRPAWRHRTSIFDLLHSMPGQHGVYARAFYTRWQPAQPRSFARSSRCSPRMLDILCVFCPSISIGSVQDSFLSVSWEILSSLATSCVLRSLGLDRYVVVDTHTQWVFGRNRGHFMYTWLSLSTYTYNKAFQRSVFSLAGTGSSRWIGSPVLVLAAGVAQRLITGGLLKELPTTHCSLSFLTNENCLLSYQ